MNPIITFIIFTIFLFCQYAIWLVSNWISHYFGLTGQLYWSMVVVSFLILNEFCFGGLAYETIVSDVPRDEEEYEWED